MQIRFNFLLLVATCKIQGQFRYAIATFINSSLEIQNLIFEIKLKIRNFRN